MRHTSPVSLASYNTPDTGLTKSLSYIPFNDSHPADSPTQRKTGHLPTGESIPLARNTPQILTHNYKAYSYAGTLDGIAYYRDHERHHNPTFTPTSPDEMNGYYLSHLWCYNCGMHKDVHVSKSEECPK
jgi:hypothetical protein